MNSTLREYLQEADNTHRKVKDGDVGTVPELATLLDKLDTNILILQSVLARITTIRAECNSARVPYPSPKPIDWRLLINRVASPAELCKLAPGADIVAKVADTEESIPNNHLYWIRNTGQFAFCINGINFRGNIGNVFTSNDRLKKYCVECNYSCLQTHRICNNFHRPSILIKNGYHLIYDCPAADVSVSVIPDVHKALSPPGGPAKGAKPKLRKAAPEYKIQTGNTPIGFVKIVGEVYHQIPIESCIRNFTNDSWMYAANPYTVSNAHKRHIGGRAVMANDIRALKSHRPSDGRRQPPSDLVAQQTAQLSDQIAHDVLLLLAITRSG